MKLSTKIFLPIILISALLISLSGCFTPTAPTPGATGTTGGTITGTFETPEACCMSNRDHTEGWVPLVNANVSVIDSKGVTHTTKTDSDGKYWLTDVAPGIYYVVTACCECEDREGVYKDVVEEKLEEGETYDAGIADCESTALGLMVDFLLSGDVFTVEDCNCYCNCFDEESQIYASLKTTGVKLRVAAVNLLNPATKPLDKIRANADFQGFVVELCDLLEACCVEPGATASTGGNGGGETLKPAISVKKTADLTCAGVGDTITYTYVIENTGNVTLTAVTAVDDLLGAVTLVPTTLGPGEKATGTLTYVVDEEDLPGPIVNTVNAKGTYGTTEVSASASASVALGEDRPDIFVTKTAVPTSAGVGDTITYTYVIENTGNVTLTAVTAVDDLLGAVTLVPTTLGPGEKATGTLTYVVDEEDLPGPIVNTVNAKGTYGPTEVFASASANVTLSGACPDISVTKTADPKTYSCLDDVINYTIVVENTGNVTLTNIVVTDPKATIISGSPITTLAPGETAPDVIASYTIVQADLDAGYFTNRATATGKDPGDADVTKSDEETVTKCCDDPCCLPQFADFNPHGAYTSYYHWNNTTDTYFPDVELAGINSGYNISNGDGWKGWCADDSHGISSVWYNYRGVVCSIYPTIDPDDYDIPYHYDEIVSWYGGSIDWNRINWIINHYIPSDTVGDIQEAIWHYTNGFATSRSRSLELIDDADVNGGGFIPAVDQKYAVILDLNLRCVGQRIFIEAIRTCCCEAWHPQQ